MISISIRLVTRIAQEFWKDSVIFTTAVLSSHKSTYGATPILKKTEGKKRKEEKEKKEEKKETEKNKITKRGNKNRNTQMWRIEIHKWWKLVIQKEKKQLQIIKQ